MSEHRNAAAWDLCRLRAEGSPISPLTLTLDLDRYSAALCESTPQGEITLRRELTPESPPAGFFARLAERAGLDEGACAARWAQQEAENSRVIRNYLKADRDKPVFQPGGGSPILCSEAAQLFRPEAQALEQLCGRVTALLGEEAIDPETVRFLPFGRMAGVYFAMAALHKYFGGSQTLEDSRFAPRQPGVHPADYPAEGARLYRENRVEARRPLGRRVELVWYSLADSGALQERRLVLAGADTDTKTLTGTLQRPEQKPQGTAVTLLVDGSPRRIPLDGLRTLTGAALKADEAEPLLLLETDGGSQSVPIAL